MPPCHAAVTDAIAIFRCRHAAIDAAFAAAITMPLRFDYAFFRCFRLFAADAFRYATLFADFRHIFIDFRRHAMPPLLLRWYCHIMATILLPQLFAFSLLLCRC